jgi:hypothetical protein
MATTLRQYTNEARAKSLSGNNDLTITIQQLNLADEIVDLYCADKIRPSINAPFYDDESVLTATFNNNIVTLTSTDNLKTNYLKYTNLRIIESATNSEEGLEFPVLNSNGLVLKIDNSSLTGSKTVILYQLGKFPRFGDTESTDNNVYKTIPELVRQASTYQAWYIAEHPELFDNSTELSEYQSESIGRGGQYSYSKGNIDLLQYQSKSDYYTNVFLSPIAKQLLAKFKIQSLI